MTETQKSQKISGELQSYYSGSQAYRDLLQKKSPAYFADYVRIVTQYIKDKDSRVLDIGCGSGLSTKLLREYYKSTFGTDISALFLQLNKSNLNFISDAHQLPVQNNSLQAVGSFEFIEHVNNAELVLAEMIRVTGKGGMIFIMSPNLYSPLIPVHSLLQYCRGIKVESPWTPTFFSIFPLFLKNCYKLLQKKLQKKFHFDYRQPDLTSQADLGGDFDSVYMANPIDIVKFLKSNNLRILNISVGRSSIGRFMSHNLPSIASGMAIIAQKGD